MIYGATLNQTQREARRNGRTISPILLENLDLPPTDAEDEKYQRFLIDIWNGAEYE